MVVSSGGESKIVARAAVKMAVSETRDVERALKKEYELAFHEAITIQEVK